jgi:hypothetical protein
MPPVGGLERFAVEALPVHGRAQHHGVHVSVEGGAIRTERLVAVPHAVVASRRQRFLPLAAPGEQQLDLRMHAQRAANLHAAAPIVVAVAAARPHRGKARLRG